VSFGVETITMLEPLALPCIGTGRFREAAQWECVPTASEQHCVVSSPNDWTRQEKFLTAAATRRGCET
jgi:hypothetical protein